MSDAVARRDATMPTAQLIAAVRDNAEHPWKPPGRGLRSALVHDVIHSLDITSPLGIERHFPAESMRAVLDSVASPKARQHFGVDPKARQHFGVDLGSAELRATDLDWSCGSGMLLLGPAQDLVLLLTGRRVPDGAF